MNVATKSEKGSEVSLARFIGYFLWLGTTGFGGPIALAGHMQQDLVDHRGWVSKEDYVEGLALAQLAPGPLAAQLAIYLGYVRAGVLGDDGAAILSAMRFGFGVPIRGNLVFLFGMALVYLFALLSMGLFISTRAQSQAQAQQMAQFLILPSIFLSGYIFPSAGLPAPLYAIGRVLPATHMVEIMRGVVLRDAGPIELLPNVLALVAMSIALVWLSVRRFNKVAL